MKNQYFGDNKDLFTYGLILQVMQAGLVNHFTFIPMLTEPDGTKHGGKIDRSQAKVGTENKELMIFLDRCVREGKRDIEQLKNFFTKPRNQGRTVSYPAAPSLGIEIRRTQR